MEFLPIFFLEKPAGKKMQNSGTFEQKKKRLEVSLSIELEFSAKPFARFSQMLTIWFNISSSKL